MPLFLARRYLRIHIQRRRDSDAFFFSEEIPEYTYTKTQRLRCIYLSIYTYVSDWVTVLEVVLDQVGRGGGGRGGEEEGLI